MSERFDLSDPSQRAAGMVAASEAIRKGELIVLPTDTVYGVGADAFTPWAVSRLLAAKGRGRDMPPPVLVVTVRAASALVDDFGTFGQDLIDEFWPGGLTLVARAQPTLAWDLGETKGTVAVRMPLHAGALELLKATGPMAVSSANTTGRPAANTVDEAIEQLGDSISVYLDGGPCGGGVASTIIDLTGSVPRLLRAGAISMDRLREVAALVTGEEVNPPGTTDEADTDAADAELAEPAADAFPESAPLDGPPDIPSDSPADARADALTSVDETLAVPADEAPAEQLMTDAGQAQLPADDPAAPITSEAATAAPPAPATSGKRTGRTGKRPGPLAPVPAAEPARARKPATPRKPAIRKPAVTSTPQATEAAEAPAGSQATEAPAVTAATEATAASEPPKTPRKPASPRKPAAARAPRKPAGERTTTRRTTTRKPPAAQPAAADSAPATPAADNAESSGPA
jgi:tRNA threonylcarbamoyl adenosine modification protein (Sua5/YciO/YrdC/YwlC family)